MNKIYYKNEFDKNFLLIKSEEKRNYKMNMILQNHIPGILDCKMFYEGQDPYLCYDVTSKKTLSQEYEEEKMQFEDIENLFHGIITVIKKTREYLLESKNICMDSEYIYYDIDTEEITLLYHPEICYEKNSQYIKLAEFLLNKVDHRDEHSVKIAYQFYKLSKEEFFSIDVFAGLVEKERTMINREYTVEENISRQETEKEEKNYLYEEEAEKEKQEQENEKRVSFFI